MNIDRFKALVVCETADQIVTRQIMEKSINELPAGDVLLQVMYSSLNYKDALSASGNKGVTKHYPHTPGIDAAGVIVKGNGADCGPGDPALVTGYDLGMNTSGGFGQFIRVPADWVVKLPKNLTMRESMIYGTAGFTAALSVSKIVDHPVSPDQGNILVTGASGGVGSIALSILAKIGYHVVAATGKMGEKQFLFDLGARKVIHRDDIKDTTDRPLLSGRWAGVVDTVGGVFLATALKETRQHGAVTSCGNVASPILNTTVYPFILRGLTLYGIDSASFPSKPRKQIWRKLSGEWKLDHLDRLAKEITLSGLDHHIELILQGKLKGRVIVNLTDNY
jgi:acrylyl-CoA reductase (NADPH)